MSAPDAFQPPPPLVISRADATDASRYRAARAQAAREGRTLEIEAPDPAANPWAPQRPADPMQGFAYNGPGLRTLADGSKRFMADRAWLSNAQNYREARRQLDAAGGGEIIVVDSPY